MSRTLTKSDLPEEALSKKARFRSPDVRVMRDALNHPVKKACKCRRKCSTKVSEVRRSIINTEFWKLDEAKRKLWVHARIVESEVMRHRPRDEQPSGHAKTKSRFYRLIDDEEHEVIVCKTFFLTTLGFEATNDRIIKTATELGMTVLPHSPQRGKHAPWNKIDKQLIKDHIESFHPVISHYRRAHAPNKRYLPCDLTITAMHKDFCGIFFKVCYTVYNETINEMNISFTKLGTEACEHCRSFDMHCRDSGHKRTEPLMTCEVCRLWAQHKDHVVKSRIAYDRDRDEFQNQLSENPNQNDNIFVAADMQKVLLLPRMLAFKTCLFTRRLVCFNETYAPLGGPKGKYNNVTVLWNEAISGRDADDLTSSLWAFLKSCKDVINITFWMDNCSGQNKNWTLISSLVCAINSTDIKAEQITLKYMEPGHTFNSADSVHHAIELSILGNPEMHTMNDLVETVKVSNKKKIDVLELKNDDFLKWLDQSSVHYLKKEAERPLLCEIYVLQFRRGSTVLFYKKSHDEKDFKSLRFLKMKINLSIPNNKRDSMRGVQTKKKEDIIKKLCPLMPSENRQFWENLPSGNVSDLLQQQA